MIRFHYCRFGFRLMIGIRSARELLMQPARNTTLGYVRTTPTTWPQPKWVFGTRQVFGYVIDLVLPTSAGSYNTAYNFTIRCRLKKSTASIAVDKSLLSVTLETHERRHFHTWDLRTQALFTLKTHERRHCSHWDPRSQASLTLKPTNAGIVDTETNARTQAIPNIVHTETHERRQCQASFTLIFTNAGTVHTETHERMHRSNWDVDENRLILHRPTLNPLHTEYTYSYVLGHVTQP